MALHMVVSHDVERGRKLVSIVSFSEEETELVDSEFLLVKHGGESWLKNLYIVQIFIVHKNILFYTAH